MVKRGLMSAKIAPPAPVNFTGRFRKGVPGGRPRMKPEERKPRHRTKALTPRAKSE